MPTLPLHDADAARLTRQPLAFQPDVMLRATLKNLLRAELTVLCRRHPEIAAAAARRAKPKDITDER